MNETIAGLTKTIDELRKKIGALEIYKELFTRTEESNKSLVRQLNIKRNVCRVIRRNNDYDELLRVEDVHDTEEGLIIRVS